MKIENQKQKVELTEDELTSILENAIREKFGRNVQVSDIKRVVKEWTEGYGMTERDYREEKGLSFYMEDVVDE